MRRWLVALLLLWPATASALPPILRAPECRGFSGDSASVRIAWATPSRTGGCFFFSGPGDLGRDDHLGTSGEWTRRGDRVSLRIGSATFEGSIRGRDVTLTRVSTHEFSGPWTVTETIQGALVGEGCARFEGRYHYDECSAGGTCPGQCHIDSALTITSR